MKIFIFIFTLLVTNCFSQIETANEQELVKATINKLFEGMYKGDSSLVHSVFHPSSRLMTCYLDKNGNERVVSEELQGFLNAVGTPHSEVWDERITFTSVLLDLHLAQVWTEYQFYVDDEFSHCGVNAFQLVKDKGEWKIIQLIDTRRKKDCIETKASN